MSSYQTFLKNASKIQETGIDCACGGCESKERTWWLCLTCNSTGCSNHQYFNGWTVRYCVVCCPQKFDLVKDKDLKQKTIQGKCLT